MKKIILLFNFLAFGFISFSQDFEPTDAYKVTATRSLVTEELLSLDSENRPAIDCYVYRSESPEKVVIKITPSEYELFDSVQVQVLKNPGLENVREVLRVEVEYSACCFWGEISYYMITDAGEMIKLPDLHQSYCDWPAVIDEYYFPIQHDGENNNIQNNSISINSEGDVDNIKTNQLLLWDGKQISVPE